MSSKTVKKPKATAKSAAPIELQLQQDRAIPNPLHDPAPRLHKIIMEHVYWLGVALKDRDAKRAQTEMNEIVRYSKLYQTFAKNPSDQKTQYSSAVDKYGDKVLD